MPTHPVIDHCSSSCSPDDLPGHAPRLAGASKQVAPHSRTAKSYELATDQRLAALKQAVAEAADFAAQGSPRCMSGPAAQHECQGRQPRKSNKPSRKQRKPSNGSTFGCSAHTLQGSNGRFEVRNALLPCMAHVYMCSSMLHALQAYSCSRGIRVFFQRMRLGACVIC